MEKTAEPGFAYLVAEISYVISDVDTFERAYRDFRQLSGRKPWFSFAVFSKAGNTRHTGHSQQMASSGFTEVFAPKRDPEYFAKRRA